MTEIDIFQRFRSLNELLDHRIENYPDKHTIQFVYQSSQEDEEMKYEKESIGEFGKKVDKITFELSKQFPPRKKNQPLRKIAIFMKNDYKTILNISSLFRLGYSCLILSLNNSIEGIIHLMKKMNCKDIIYSPEKENFIKELEITFKKEHQIQIQHSLWIEDFNKLPIPKKQIRTELSYDEEIDEVLIIMHSSGSTGLPKPLPITNKALCINFVGSRIGGVCCLPYFHIAGFQTLFISFQLLQPVFTLPTNISQTSSNLIKLAKLGLKENCSQFICVPLTLKLLSESQTGIQTLSNYKMICYLGSPCPKQLGDHLVKQGVNLVTILGSTESGYIMSSIRDFKNDKEWDVMRPRSNFGDFLRFEIVDELGTINNQKVAEMVIEKGWPPLVVSNRPDGAFATSDLFLLHPTLPKSGTYLSRRDDALVHVNGEKTNPLLIEQDLRTSNLIKEALVFGSGKMNTGCLIIPYNNDTTIEDLWPIISIANKNAQTHSRLMKEMVVILSPLDEFILTDKKTVIRFKTLQRYQDIIEKTYRKFEQGDESDRKSVKDLNQAKSIIRSIIVNVLNEQDNTESQNTTNSIKDDDNLFDHGFDSLAVIRVSNTIRRQVKFPDNLQFPDSAAFQYPTIATLSDYVFKLASGMQNGVHNGNEEDVYETMTTLLETYKKQIIPRSSAGQQNGHSYHQSKQTILLTGATGSLGAHLLVNYAKQQGVSSIICLCRASSDKDAYDRVERSLQERKLPSIKQIDENVQIICLKSDLSQPDLGLQIEQISNILNQVTTIVHAAWPVNFSMGIHAFHSSVQASINLINISSRSKLFQPIQILFCSSIAAAGNHQILNSKGESIIPEELSSNPKDAIGNGYGQSKWIAERLFEFAPSQIQNLNITIARIGQLSGDLENGIWNEKEAYPLLIKTAQTINCLPDLSNHSLYWLPVDVAAKMIVEISEEDIRIIHIASIQPTKWDMIFKAIQSAYPKVQQISLQEWIKALKTTKNQDPKSNPAIKLIDYYSSWIIESDGKVSKNNDIFSTRFETSNILNIFKNKNPDLIKQAGTLSQETLRKMINSWQSNGFLKPSSDLN